MKILFSIGSVFFLSLVGFHTQAQTIQWATKVIGFSSQLSPVQYSAEQALGKPNVLPGGGQNPNAWVPDKPNRKEFLKVGFDNPVPIRQIAIAESYNPSALYKVYVYDQSDREYEINTLNPRVVPLRGRMLNLFFEETKFKVSAVKLEFDGAAVPDYYGIDAVGITNSPYPIVADIVKPELLASGIIVEALDKNVNSEYPEYNPILSPDGQTLYFGRKNHPENTGGVNDKEDIWYSELDPATGQWTLAKNLGTQINNSEPNFINSISAVTPDGKTSIMVLGNKYIEGSKKMEAGVSISTNVSGQWSKPKPLTIVNDYNYFDKVNYFLANNRITLLMSVQRADSKGDRDLYVSFLQADSTWSEPRNLGSIINTAGDESAPFVALDDETLYFSSNGFSGYGGSDIYVSKRLDDSWTNWSEPKNMGPEINSNQEDLFFNIPANSEHAYYSRGVSETNTDIFRVKLPFLHSPDPWVTVTGKLMDKKNNTPLGAKIIYERLPDGKDMGIAESNSKTGEYDIKLPGGHLYSVRAEAKNHISESQTLDLRHVTSDVTLTDQNFTLDPIQVVKIEANALVRLNTIFFDFAKAILKPESFPELERIADVMKSQSTITVEIAGHTDNVGSDQANQKLSERRAEAVRAYLISKGIQVNRINAIGYGESKPIVSNDDEKDGRELNRRVEFKIIKL
jgi:OOP family OmpA-OmpF porin